MLSSCSRGTTDLLIGGDRPCSGVWTRTRRRRKTQETEVWWKCFFRASPSINHSNYLPQLQECAGRAAPLTAAEVRNTLRSGWQRQHEPADYIKKKALSIKMREINSTASLLPTWPGPAFSSLSPLCLLTFIYILEFIRTGSAKLSVSMQHLFYQDFGIAANSLSHTVQLRAPYLVMLCISWELRS